jgi:hypothetical protein
MSNIKVVYVTRTGHARSLAEEVAKLAGGTAIEIKDKVNRRGLFGYMRTGSQAMRNLETPIGDPGVDLSAATAVILVQPVWASSPCPPMRTWINAHRAELKGKKLGLLLIDKASPGEPIRATFEKEFGALSAFAWITERTDTAERARTLASFAKALEA